MFIENFNSDNALQLSTEIPGDAQTVLKNSFFCPASLILVRAGADLVLCWQRHGFCR